MEDEIQELRVQLETVLSAFRHIERHFRLKVLQSRRAREKGDHANIPYSPKDFLNKIVVASKLHARIAPNRKVHFLDVGCGVGTKVFLASYLFEGYRPRGRQGLSRNGQTPE